MRIIANPIAPFQAFPEADFHSTFRIKERILPFAADIYRYLEFDKIKNFTLGYP